MEKRINHIKKYKMIFLRSLLLSITMPLLGMEPEKPATKNEASAANWKSFFAQLNQTTCNNAKDSTERKASLERLRLSGQRTMGAWQHQASQRVPQPEETSTQPIQKLEFEGCITALAAIPFTTKLVISSHNQLHRVEACNQTTQTISLPQPIAKLIPSADGSLCAILLMPKKDCFPEIRFINACKSSLEVNADIEPIPYYRTDEYEMGQEADFSADARYLATVSSQNTACIHKLSANSSHAIISKNEREFPVFSVHFLKNTCAADTPEKPNQLAVHSNLETSIHSISDAGCQELYRINHQQATKPLDYAPRQAAWMLSDMLAVRIGKKLLVYNAKKEIMHTFTVGKNSVLSVCAHNNCLMLEYRKDKKIRMHDLSKIQTIEIPISTYKQTFIDESAKVCGIAHNNELMFVVKPQPDDAKKK